MATSPTDPTQIDRLSILPEALLITILSLLPTQMAARTSVLSRRFQHLWKASPSVDLSVHTSAFKAMANSALLSREPSTPLLRLRLNVNYPLSNGLTHLISSLLVHAHSLGLRHLTLDGYGNWYEDFQPIVCSVFSIRSLESLSISLRTFSKLTFPPGTTLTHLKSLSINNLDPVISAQVERLLSELCCWEQLQLTIAARAGVVSLSSLTIRKLDLFFTSGGTDSVVGLSMPSLEFLYLESQWHRLHLPHIHGDIPLLRKSAISLHGLRPKEVPFVAQLLNYISHVKELSLDLGESVVLAPS